MGKCSNNYNHSYLAFSRCTTKSCHIWKWAIMTPLSLPLDGLSGQAGKERRREEK